MTFQPDTDHLPKLTKLAATAAEAMAAGFSGIWIRTFEPDEAVRELHGIHTRQGWAMFVWDCIRQLYLPNGEPVEATTFSDVVEAPRAGLDAAVHYLLKQPNDDWPCFIVLKNLHMQLEQRAQPKTIQLIQMLQTALGQAETIGKCLIGIAPYESQIPAELEKQFYVIDHELPTADELWTIAVETIENSNTDTSGKPTEIQVAIPDAQEKKLMLDAAAGLTRSEFNGAVGLSLTRHGQITANTMWELKEQTVRRNGLLDMYRGTAGFEMLGGLEPVKDFALKCFSSPNLGSRGVRARGIALLGVQGTGKSAFAKCLGKEVKRPTLSLNIGRLMGGLVGKTEENTRLALATIDAMAPCVLFIDEIDKAMGTMGRGSDPVGGRLKGTLMTWLNDHESDVFVVCTSNDISEIGGAFFRSERFDATFFMDFPPESSREAIWKIYLEYFGISENHSKVDDNLWTGAEIRSCCRLSRLQNLSLAEASRLIVPAALADSETLSSLREWASSRTLSADYPGRYSLKRGTDSASNGVSGGRRRVQH